MRKDKLQILQEKSDARLAQIKSSHVEAIDRKMKKTHEKFEALQLKSKSVLDYQETVDSNQRIWNELRFKIQEQTNLNQQKKMEKLQEMLVSIDQRKTELELGHDRVSEK